MLVDCYYMFIGVEGDCLIEVVVICQGDVIYYEVFILYVVGVGIVGFNVMVNDRDVGVCQGWFELVSGMGWIKFLVGFVMLVIIGELLMFGVFGIDDNMLGDF